MEEISAMTTESEIEQRKKQHYGVAALSLRFYLWSRTENSVSELEAKER
jgi:hypothetical protein